MNLYWLKIIMKRKFHFNAAAFSHNVHNYISLCDSSLVSHILTLHIDLYVIPRLSPIFTSWSYIYITTFLACLWYLHPDVTWQMYNYLLVLTQDLDTELLSLPVLLILLQHKVIMFKHATSNLLKMIKKSDTFFYQAFIDKYFFVNIQINELFTISMPF